MPFSISEIQPFVEMSARYHEYGTYIQAMLSRNSALHNRYRGSVFRNSALDPRTRISKLCDTWGERGPQVTTS